jgi:hypothetical protein
VPVAHAYYGRSLRCRTSVHPFMSALSQIFVCRRCEVSEPCQGGRLGGEGIELFGRGKALVFDFNHHLPFLNHVHELNTCSGSH